MLNGLSLPHLIVLLVIVVLIFGTKKLRNIGGDLGNTIKEFKKALNSDSENKTEQPASPPPVTKEDASQNNHPKPS